MIPDFREILIEFGKKIQNESTLFDSSSHETAFMSDLKKDLKTKLSGLTNSPKFGYMDYINLLLHEPKKVKQVVERWEDSWIEKISDFEFEIEEIWEQTIQEAKEDLVDMFNFDEDEVEDWDDDDVVSQFGEGDIFAIWTAKLKDLKSEYHNLVNEIDIDSESFRERFSKKGRHGPSTTMDKIDEMHKENKQLKENVVKITNQIQETLKNNKRNILNNIFEEESELILY